LQKTFNGIPVARIQIPAGTSPATISITGPGIIGPAQSFTGIGRVISFTRSPNNISFAYFFADGSYGTSTITVAIDSVQTIKQVTFIDDSTPTPTPDTEAPKVDWKNSSISKTLISYGEEVSVKVRITDNVGTIDVNAYFYANYALSEPIGAPISKKRCQRYDGDGKDGFWQCTGLVIYEKLSKDDQYCVGFDARDGAGNLALGQSIGCVKLSSPIPPSSLIPTKVAIDAPTQISLGSDGKASVQIYAYVQPTDLTKLPPGRSSLDVDLVFKGSGGSGCPTQPVESISTLKEGYKFFILNYSLSTQGSCSGTFQFYGDSVFEKANYPTFTFNVLPYVDVKAISISDVSLYSQSVSPGGIATIYYLIRNAGSKPTAGLGAGIGEFGAEPGPFGEDYSSIGWTLGLVKGDSSNGYYKSNISIPLTAKPGVYKTWVFWKGVTGPIYGPDLTILGVDTNQNDALKSFAKFVQEAQAAFSDLVNKAVWAKFGDGGGYRYIKLRPEPPAEYFANPRNEYFGLYKATLNAWAQYEISNLRIENYTKPKTDALVEFCVKQSQSTALSLKESDNQLANIKARINNFQSLNQKEKQVEYSAITEDLKSIGVNLNIWIDKLPYYQTVNKDCISFSNLLANANALFATKNSLLENLNRLSIENPKSATYLKLFFAGDNKILTGEELFLGGIDSTGNGRGSIEINAFLRAYETKLMYGNESLNYRISSTTSTPEICKVSPPKYFLGTNNPFTKFSLTPLNEGKCLLNFISEIEGRSDLIGANTSWVSIVKSGSELQVGKPPTPPTSPSPTPPTIEDDGAEEDFYATLSVSKRSDGKYRLAILSNVVEDQLIITATKKGAKSIVYKVQTSEFGGISILTSRNLAGFILTLRFDGEKLASVKAK
jgi:hypothetical protein